MGRSDKSRLVVVFEAAALLAVVIGVACCEVGVRSDEEIDDGSSGSSSGGSSSVQAHYSGHAEGERGHSCSDAPTATSAAAAAAAIVEADGLREDGVRRTSPQDQCERRWDVLLKELEALLLERSEMPREEMEESPDHPKDQDRQGECDPGGADNDKNNEHNDDDDITNDCNDDEEEEENGGEEEDEDGEKEYRRVNLEMLAVFRGCEEQQETMMQTLQDVMHRLHYVPHPVNPAPTASSASWRTWEERVEHWMLWGKRVVDGAITVAVVVCVLLCALLCSLLIPPRLVMSYSKDPDMGTQYFYLTVKYYIVTASISAVIRRVVRRETSKQRAYAIQHSTAKREVLKRERETLYEAIQSTNRTYWAKDAEHRLAQLRLRSAWTALNLARLSGDQTKAARERDAAIRKATEINANILLRAQRRREERVQQVAAAAPSD